MENVNMKLTKFNINDKNSQYDVVMELHKFLGDDQQCLIAYYESLMFMRMMAIKSEIKYLVERHMYNDVNSPLGKGYRYYLPECDLYLEIIIYKTGVLHIECLEDDEDEKIDDNIEIFVTKFKIETIPSVLPAPTYLVKPESDDDSNVQKLLYWIEKGFGKILSGDEFKSIFRMTNIE